MGLYIDDTFLKITKYHGRYMDLSYLRDVMLLKHDKNILNASFVQLNVRIVKYRQKKLQ